jgi:hypothetical protein
MRTISTVGDMVDDRSYVNPECFRAYINAEIKVPNTLIAVGPYVGHAALASLPAGDDLGPALTRFAETYSFSVSQRTSASKTVVLIHRRFGIPVLPEGVDLLGQTGVRAFPHERFEVVYMEGVFNILEAILRLHGRAGKRGVPRQSAVADALVHPDALATTVAAFAAAEKDGIQAAVAPLIAAAVQQALAARGSAIPRHQVDDFVGVLTSPELHDEAR